jgi:hypothetical protein
MTPAEAKEIADRYEKLGRFKEANEVRQKYAATPTADPSAPEPAPATAPWGMRAMTPVKAKEIADRYEELGRLKEANEVRQEYAATPAAAPAAEPAAPTLCDTEPVLPPIPPMRPTGATDQTYYEAWTTGQLDYHEACELVAAFGAFSGLWCLLFLMGLWGARKGLPLEIEEVIVELNEKALNLIYFLGG